MCRRGSTFAGMPRQPVKIDAAQGTDGAQAPGAQFDQALGTAGHVHGPMTGGDPGLAGGANLPEYPIDSAPIVRVQAIVELIQQQPVRCLDESARQQRETLLTIGQRQEPPLPQVLESAPFEHRRGPPPFLKGDRAEQQIGSMQAAGHEVVY